MIEDRIDITTSPSARDRRAYVIGFFLYTLVAAIPILLAAQWRYLNTPSGRPPGWVFAIALSIGGLVSTWFTCRSIGRQMWRLTSSELRTGISGGTRYPLSSIEKIIVGLPDQLSKSALSVVARPGTLETYARSQENALLLKFQDGSMLPLKLRLYVNGPLLAYTLTELLKDRVLYQYDYSEEERRLLKWADPNALIRRRA